MFHEVFLELYNRTFLIISGKTDDEINEFLKKRLQMSSCEIEWTDCLGCVEKVTGEEESIIVIYLHSTVLDRDNIGTIAHEADHAANYVFKHCGIKPDLENDEPHTYLVGWITKQIVGACNEHNTKRC